MPFADGSVHRGRLNLKPAFANHKATADVTDGYDFGSGQPVPWTSKAPNISKDIGLQGTATFNGAAVNDISHHVGARNNGAARPSSDASPFSSPFRNFSRSADGALLDYLRSRNVSPYFLCEIDKFLAAHPEIAHHRPQFLHQINHSSPLEAYRFFIRGYTKPARYVEGFLPDLYNIPLPTTIVPVLPIYDEELALFFTGYEYRYDILDKIDHEVIVLANALCHGHNLRFAERKLLAYALYANVVDTYKFYEYNYQMDWLAHRYLPEHVILQELPKQTGYTEPTARQLAEPDEDCQENMRSHSGTRARMARACDAGVDVIDVLLEDFTAALCRQGLRRDQIEYMRREAIRNIDHQRSTQGSRDIVDMVMDRASMTRPEHFGRPAPKRTTGRIHRIASLKHALQRLWMQEAGFEQEKLPDFVDGPIKRMRKRVERELVFEVTQLASEGGVMSGMEVHKWRSMFTKKAQAEREVAGLAVDVLEGLSRYL